MAHSNWGAFAAVLLISAQASPTVLATTTGEPQPAEPQAAQQPLSLGSTSQTKGRRWELGLHTGWWDAGADLTMPAGLFVGVGMPWVAPLLFDYSGRQSQWALDSRIGYGYKYSDTVTIYGEILSAWVYDSGDPCGDGCISRTHRLFFFPAIGLRHRWASGFTVGADLTLAVFSWHHVDDSAGPHWIRKNISPVVGLAFSQAYVGFDWFL